jgi:hypothetical protein
MTQPAVRSPAMPPSSVVVTVRAPGTTALSTRFADLLQQRRPPAPQAPDAEPVAELEARPGAEQGDWEPHPQGLPVRPRDVEPDGEPDAEVDGETAEPPPVALAVAGIAEAADPQAACRAAMREVALTIAGFCNDRAVNNGDLWQVRMGLRADVVPGTTLNLALSPHWLTLRFEVGDAAGLDLLSRGREALVQVLENTLARRREISISFESP